ncbi:E3 ubiquitin-protein ligase BOI [Quillaja saponaria]|nr:E3 ubiquitin-protein ligase BOI [Quillaja saponaria]
MTDIGCGVFNPSCFNLQQKHQQLQQLQNQQQRNQNMAFDNSILVSNLKAINNNHQSISYSQIMAAQVEKQRLEIDHYIRLQNERLRIMLQEQKKQQLMAMMQKIESKAVLLLRQKDEEIAQARKRMLELEDFYRKLEAENQAWQRVAEENEATVMFLNHTLEQMRERACCFNNGEEDAESCCNENRGDIEVEEETWEAKVGDFEKQRKGKIMMVCKGCNSRSSCILFLPCRHLCSCKACEAFLEACPVCKTAKKASIEALIF